MRKVVVLLYFLSIICYGQQSLNPDLITFPVSPEAARMVTYGNTPVNLFYGQLDKTIELFTGKVGDFELPINLSYSYAGFRVEETPSIVGLGWQLTTGGVITREVRGYPDEHPKGYYGGQQNIIGTYFNTGVMNYQQAESLLQGESDTEADLYSVSVNGIFFNFKIGTNGKPAFLTKHNYILEVTRNPTSYNDITSFKLTDTSGNVYVFSEREFTQRVEGHDAVFEDNFPKYVTSWQLSSIKLNNNSVITYNYQNDNFYSYSYYASGDNGILLIQLGNNQDPQATYNQGSAKDLIERKLLTGITTDNFMINFLVSSINGQDVYSKIIIKDKNLKSINTFDFEYKGTRNCLFKIYNNNQFFYEFDYHGDENTFAPFINSTHTFPWNQDFWGFSNGKNNIYAFSRPDIGNGSALTADRSPNFNHTIEGALREIKYQTGGSTIINYEQNTIAEYFESNNTTPNVRMEMEFASDSKPDSPTYKEKVFTKTFNEMTIVKLSHWIESTPWGDLEMSIERVEECQQPQTITIVSQSPNTGSVSYTYYTPDGDYSQVIPQLKSLGYPLPSICPQLHLSFSGDGCDGTNCNSSGNSGGTFLIIPGTYEFKFKTMHNRSSYTNAGIILEYYRPDVEENQTLINKQTGGIRVKNITDYPVEGNPITTYYDYNDDTGISTARIFSNLINEVKYGLAYVNYFSNPEQVTITSPTYISEYSARPYNLLQKHGIPVYYKTVKKYTDVEDVFVPTKILCDGCTGSYNFSYIGSGQGFGTTYKHYKNGFTQISFDIPMKTASDYPFEPVGDDISVGRISENKIFSATDINHKNNIFLSEKTRYNYYGGSNQTFVDSNLYYPKSLKLGYKYRMTVDAQNFSNNLTLENCLHLITYKESDMETLILDKTTTEYFGENYTEKLEKNIYNSHRQLQKQTIISNLNKVNETLTTDLYYPYDMTDNVSQAMVSKNVISPIAKVIRSRNNEVIETTQFNYVNVINNLFKPKSFLKSKANNTLEERMYYGYDTKGNMNLMYKEKIHPNISQNLNNNRTIIVWGYNQSLPIAKIENVDLATLPSSIISDLQAKSNADNDNISICSASTCKEQQLRQALDNLRISYPQALITTYTYDPLIGITSITDSLGKISTYEYDAEGRLLRVKDNQGNIISENKYNYTTQN